MGRTTTTSLINFLPFIHLAAILLHSGPAASISTKQKDVTTPMTTIPITNPSTPTTTTPMLNPTQSSGSESPTITTTNNPTTTTQSSPSAGRSWCVASQSASQHALQVALDYACGYGGADCSEIQPGGQCFDPVTLQEHASYAFNSYYQKNPIPNSCNFAGSAVTTSIDPSYDSCQYPSTSTTSSILNTTNSIGSHVYGAGPINPSPPSAAAEQSHYFKHGLLSFIIIIVISCLR